MNVLTLTADAPFTATGPPEGLPVAIEFHWNGVKNVELRQFSEFCWVDQAHATMLIETGILPLKAGKELLGALRELESDGADKLPQNPLAESILSYIEAGLASKVGKDTAAMLHTARSRIDQSATVSRLACRRPLLDVMSGIVNLMDAMLAQADKHVDTIMPYYTCLQQAQPGTFGHYLAAQVERLSKDLGRCISAYAELNENPLGGVGRSGTAFAIDRKLTTKFLGFDREVHNSLLCRDADHAATILFALAMVMSHIYEVATDFQLWFTQEFNFITLPDEYCCVSSLFPQKKNPIALDHMRISCGPSAGWAGSAFATFKGMGTGDHMLRGTPQAIDTAFDAVMENLRLLALVIANIEVKAHIAKCELTHGWTTLSNLSDWLYTNREVPVRLGYMVAKNVKQQCDKDGKRRADITPGMIVAAVSDVCSRTIAMTEQDVNAALDPEQFVLTRTSAGGVAPQEVKRMLDGHHANIVSSRNLLATRDAQINGAKDELAKAIDGILSADNEDDANVAADVAIAIAT